MIIRAFIQARMTSARLPGKVLARLDGIPVISRVVDRVLRAVPKERIVVTTSTDKTDDALAEAAASLGVSVHRGPLDNVVRRFQLCLEQYPCDWCFRVCADSPLLDPDLLSHALTFVGRKDVDLVTNVFPRTFPRGQSVEMIRSAALAKIDAERLSPEDREHVTRYFYSHPDQFAILNFQSVTDLSGQSFTVDTPEDLTRLEKFVQAGGALPHFEVKT